MSQHKMFAKQDVRKLYLNEQGNVNFNKIQATKNELKNIKVSLINKHHTQAVVNKVKTLPAEDQQQFLADLTSSLWYHYNLSNQYGIGRRQSILGKFPNLSKQGTDEATVPKKGRYNCCLTF